MLAPAGHPPSTPRRRMVRATPEGNELRESRGLAVRLELSYTTRATRLELSQSQSICAPLRHKRHIVRCATLAPEVVYSSVSLAPCLYLSRDACLDRALLPPDGSPTHRPLFRWLSNGGIDYEHVRASKCACIATHMCTHLKSLPLRILFVVWSLLRKVHVNRMRAIPCLDAGLNM